jgi:hypothetical protein
MELAFQNSVASSYPCQSMKLLSPHNSQLYDATRYGQWTALPVLLRYGY